MVTQQIKLFCCRIRDCHYLAAKAWGKYVVLFLGAVAQRLHYGFLPQQLAKPRQCSLHLRAVASALPFPLFVLGEVCTAGSVMGGALLATVE